MTHWAPIRLPTWKNYRQVELARLNALQEAYWSSAVSGTDLRSADFVQKVIGQRSKLLGLDQLTPAQETLKMILMSGDSESYKAGLMQFING